MGTLARRNQNRWRRYEPPPQRMTRLHPILLMSDDQGWGDVGFNGNEVIKAALEMYGNGQNERMSRIQGKDKPAKDVLD